MTDISSKQVIMFIIKMVRPFPVAITVMVIVAFVWALDLSIRPYILKIILNRISATSSVDIFPYLAVPIAAYLFMAFLHVSVFRLYGYFVEIKLIPNLRQKISQSSFETLLDQSHHYYQNHFSGSIANKINDLTNSIPDLLQIIIDRFLSTSLALLIAIYTLSQVNVKFAISMTLWVSLFIVGSVILSKRQVHLSDIWSECGSTITGKIVDGLSNILSIRLFSTKNEEKSSLYQAVGESVKAEQKLQWSYFLAWCVYGYSFIIMQAFNLYFLMKGRQEGLISVGDFALVLMISVAISDFLWNLAKDLSHFSKLFGKVTQALRTIIVAPDIQDKPDAKPILLTKGEIVFDNVHFNYKGGDILFRNKSITIKHGQKIGLVGYSGSGKSTFVNLILRLFDVNSGRIKIDGQDIRDVTQDSLRQCISMIPQDPSLFHRTIMENIRYGKLDATDEEITEAAKSAHADEFITSLNQGYKTLVGERGVKLSGGQRQRISIARAILKNAPILILDEATSQMDSVTENYIQESFKKLMKGRTTIVIAHRLATLINMDRILVFEKGKIVEDGSHDELLERNGLYKKLWDAQIGGFIPTNESQLEEKRPQIDDLSTLQLIPHGYK